MGAVRNIHAAEVEIDGRRYLFINNELRAILARLRKAAASTKGGAA